MPYRQGQTVARGKISFRGRRGYIIPDLARRPFNKPDLGEVAFQHAGLKPQPSDCVSVLRTLNSGRKKGASIKSLAMKWA